MPEREVPQEILHRIYSTEMFPPENVSDETGPGNLRKYDSYKATGRNMLAVLKEYYLSGQFNPYLAVGEAITLLDLTPDETRSVFPAGVDDFADTVLERYIVIKRIARPIKPDAIPAVFRRPVPVYSGATRLEMLARGEADYMLGNDFWLSHSTS